MIKTFGKAFILSLAALSASVVAVGCSTGQRPGEGDVDDNGSVGKLGLQLQFGSVIVNTVSYSITGNGFTRTGTFSVAGPGSTFTTQIGGIPAGNGYSITLNATATDGVTTGTGSATFNITARQQTAVSIQLVFRGPSATDGTLLINGSSNFAPSISSLTSLPASLPVGATSALVAVASDLDNGPSALTYAWTSGAGGTVTTGATTATFTATAVGNVTVTLVVSDGNATDTLPIVLQVVAAGGGGTGAAGIGAAGAGAAGDGAAGTGAAGTGAAGTGAAGTGAAGDGAAGTGAAGTGAAGTGAAGTGAAGTGAAGTGVVDACLQCETNGTQGCSDAYALGNNLVGNAVAGPSAGTARTVLFHAIIDCFHTSHCATNSTSDCLCGIGANSSTCFQAASVASLTGPCKDQIAAGAETTIPSDINSRFYNDTLAIGAATGLSENCDQFSCVDECL